MRTMLIPAIVLLAAVLAAVSRLPALGLAARLAFVLATAPAIGGTLLLAISRLVGADWPAPLRPRWWWALLAAAVMLTATGTPLPPQLAIWSAPPFVAPRAAIALALIVWADGRLRAGAGSTLAGLTLALYAAMVTPIAADWLLPAAPGQPVSAIGMMLCLVQIAAACAAGALASDGRVRGDLSRLLVAALLGLCYLGFVDYLIVWFGNLPARVPFYQLRGGWLALAAMLVGFGGTVAAIVAGRTRVAAAATAAGLALFLTWWIGLGAIAAATALAVLLGLAIAQRRAFARG